MPPLAADMHTSDFGKAFIKGYEDLRLTAYPDPKTGGAPWTNGWGTTRGVHPGDVWTAERAEAEFELDVLEAEACVRRYVTHEMTQGQFDAFVSIFQNVGPGSKDRDGIGRLKSGTPSTLLRCFNAGDIGGAEDQWTRWISPGSNVETGLLRRRRAELVMFRST